MIGAYLVSVIAAVMPLVVPVWTQGSKDFSN
jgi:hypothetical protein